MSPAGSVHWRAGPLSHYDQSAAPDDDRASATVGVAAPSPSPAGTMPMPAERHLLLGLLALQTGLIQPSQLVAAFHAWTGDKSRSLADHAIALGHLAPPSGR